MVNVEISHIPVFYFKIMERFKTFDYIYLFLLTVSFLFCTVHSLRSQSLSVACKKQPAYILWIVAGVVASYVRVQILRLQADFNGAARLWKVFSTLCPSKLLYTYVYEPAPYGI